MMGRQAADQGQLFYEFNLDDMIPKDHLLRRMNRLRHCGWPSSRAAEAFYSDIGRLRSIPS